MHQYKSGAPMEQLTLDVMGSLPLSSRGNKYLLVVADYFTKWTEAFPLPNQETGTVAEALVNKVVCRFGVPLELHSDEGRNFESAVFSEMCNLLGIKKTHITPLHPQSDGMVERFNRTLEAQLAKFVEHRQQDWDEHIPYMMLAYRSAFHDTTRSTPVSLMLGRELKLSIDLLFPRPEENDLVTTYADTLRDRMERVHRFARSHLQLASDRMKRYYDASVREMSYKRGDPVWLYNPQRKKGISPKFQRPWHGPNIVMKKIKDVIYRVQLSPHTKPKVIHHNRLAPYQGQNIQNWLQNQDARQQQASEITSVGNHSATNMQTETNVRTGGNPRNNNAEFPRNDNGELVPPLR